MNYQHAFHAGNPGDVLKHVVLVALVRAMQRKPAPWLYLDTHAGAGGYDLSAGPAQRTGEWRAGIGALWDWRDAPAGPLRDYLAAVRAAQPGERLGYYPGSPELVRALARENDRLALCELHPEVHAALRHRFGRDAQVAVHARDGYEAMGALLPPPQRRGLVLIDPPYERADEAARAAGALAIALRRFAGGVYALWYPIKSDTQAGALRRAVRAAVPVPVLDVWLRVADVMPAGGLAGAGMLVANAPFGVHDVLRPALGALSARLGGVGAGWHVGPLAGDRRPAPGPGPRPAPRPAR